MPDEEAKMKLVKRSKTQLIVPHSEIEVGREYLESVNLPPEALPSIIISYQTALAIKKMIEEERKLTQDQRMALVAAKDDIVITPFVAEKVERFVKDFQFPYSTLYLSQTGNTITVNPKAIGWRMKLRADPRIFKSWEPVSVDYKEFPDEKIVTVRLVAHFWNGESYSATGSCSSKERGKKDWPFSTLEMTAETRAQNRAIRASLGLPFEVAEDVIEWQEQERALETFETTSAPSEEMTRMKFITIARVELGYSVRDILARLGVTKITDISDFAEALEKLKAIREQEAASTDDLNEP